MNGNSLLLAAAVGAKRVTGVEDGPLYWMGRRWFDRLGRTWNWRGTSCFTLPARAREGQDIDRILRWFIARGVNMLRIWPDVTLTGGSRALDDPAAQRELHDLLITLRDVYQVRAEVTAVLDFNQDFNERRALASAVAEIVADFDGYHALEDQNEPWLGGQWPPLYNSNPGAAPRAYGICPVNGPGQGSFRPPDYQNCPRANYVTTHLPRDTAHYYRNSKDLYEMWGLNVPLVDDEPLGVADYDKDGSGARSTNLQWHVWHHAIARLYGGSTVHSQCGLEGRAPAPDEPTTVKIYDAIAQVWAAIPDDVYLGRYSRNDYPNYRDFPDFPLEVSGTDSPDAPGNGAHPGTAYAIINGNIGYVVVAGARDGYEPKLRGGWTGVQAIGPAGCALYKVTR